MSHKPSTSLASINYIKKKKKKRWGKELKRPHILYQKETNNNKNTITTKRKRVSYAFYILRLMGKDDILYLKGLRNIFFKGEKGGEERGVGVRSLL